MTYTLSYTMLPTLLRKGHYATTVWVSSSSVFSFLIHLFPFLSLVSTYIVFVIVCSFFILNVYILYFTKKKSDLDQQQCPLAEVRPEHTLIKHAHIVECQLPSTLHWQRLCVTWSDIAVLLFAEFGLCHIGRRDNGIGYSALQEKPLYLSNGLVYVDWRFTCVVAAW